MRAVLLAGVLTCASMSAIQAENDVKEKVTGYYMSYDENGNLVSQNIPDFSGMRSDNHTEVTLVKSGHDSSRDCGYHPDTNVWRKVNQYHFNTSNTVNITLQFTIGGRKTNGTIGISRTTSQTFGYTINADVTRFSKIKVYASYDWKYYKASVIDNISGDVVYTYYYISLYKTHEEFRPVYQ